MVETAVVDPEVKTEPIVDPALGTGPDWRSSIPEDLKASELWKPYEGKGLGDVLKGYANAAALIGKKPEGLKIPDATAKPEEKAAFDGAVRKALGVPEQPTGYKVTRPDIALD